MTYYTMPMLKQIESLHYNKYQSKFQQNLPQDKNLSGLSVGIYSPPAVSTSRWLNQKTSDSAMKGHYILYVYFVFATTERGNAVPANKARYYMQ